MVQYDNSRWVTLKDGSRRRAVTDERAGINATEGAAEIAASYGLDLTEVEGTGAGGRITKKDVEDYLAADEEEDEE